MLTPDILASIPDGGIHTVEPGLRLYRRGALLHWQARFRVDGKRIEPKLGTWPDMDLDAARAKAAKLRGDTPAAIVAKGIAKAIKAGKGAAAQMVADAVTPSFLRLDIPTFKEMADTWMIRPLKSGKQKTKATEKQHNISLAHLKPLWDRDINTITRIDCREVLQAVQAAVGPQTADRCQTLARKVFGLYCSYHDATFPNPCADTTDWLYTWETEHHAALTEPSDVAQLMRDVDGLPASTVAHALQLIARTVVRQSELRSATWAEFDIPNALWTIPAERMKGKVKREHVVPLSRQALAILDKQRALLGETAPHKLVFPCNPNAAAGHSLSGSAMSSKLDSMGYKGRHTPHGFRSAFSKLAEDSGQDDLVIEFCLAHADKNTVRKSYKGGATKHRLVPQRREILQWYADMIDSLTGAS